MLNDAQVFSRVFIATGYSDLRKGIDGLANIIKFQFELDPFQKDILFLFCGRRTDRLKGLVWEGDGFLLLYKRLNAAVSAGHARLQKQWRLLRNSTGCFSVLGDLNFCYPQESE